MKKFLTFCLTCMLGLSTINVWACEYYFAVHSSRENGKEITYVTSIYFCEGRPEKKVEIGGKASDIQLFGPFNTLSEAKSERSTVMESVSAKVVPATNYLHARVTCR